MTTRKRSDTATEADWSFLEIPGVVDGLRACAVDLAGGYSDELVVDADDLLQEAVVFIAVRKNLGDRRAPIIVEIGRRAMTDRLQTLRRRAARVDSLDRLAGDE